MQIFMLLSFYFMKFYIAESMSLYNKKQSLFDTTQKGKRKKKSRNKTTKCLNFKSCAKDDILYSLRINKYIFVLKYFSDLYLFEIVYN